MAFPISCPACGASYRIPDALFASRFAGRATTIKCKKCGASVPVDGTQWRPGAVESLPPEINDFVPESIRPAEVAPVSVRAELPTSSAPPGVPASSRPPSSSVPASSRPPSARPRSLTPRPWVGLKSISIVPAAPSSSRPPDAAPPSSARKEGSALRPSPAPPPEARITVQEQTETPTRDDLPARSRVPEVAPIQETPTVAAPIAALASTPKLPPADATAALAEAPPSSRPPVSRPPPLPESARLPPVTTSSSPPSSASRPPPSVRSNRPRQKIATGARTARMVALAVGVGIATVWIGSRARLDDAEQAQAVAVDAALQQAQALVRGCDPGETSLGVAQLTLTFAPTGKVASADVGDGSLDPRLRACILAQVQGLEIPAFQGSPIEVRREIAIGH